MCLKNMLECFKINFQPVACHAGSAVKKNPCKQCKKKVCEENDFIAAGSLQRY